MCAHPEQGGVVDSVCYKQAVEGAFCHLLGEILGPWSGPPWPFPAGSWRASPSLHPMTPGSGAFSWGAESLCLAPASCQEGRRFPAKALSHLKEKQTHLQIPEVGGRRWEVGGGGLANGLGGRSVLSLLRWCRRAGIQPPPSTVTGLSFREQCFAGWTDMHLEG